MSVNWYALLPVWLVVTGSEREKKIGIAPVCVCWHKFTALYMPPEVGVSIGKRGKSFCNELLCRSIIWANQFSMEKPIRKLCMKTAWWGNGSCWVSQQGRVVVMKCVVWGGHHILVKSNRWKCAWLFERIKCSVVIFAESYKLFQFMSCDKTNKHVVTF